MSGHTRVPSELLDALQTGDINRTQFAILVLMHSWADFQTGRVRSFSALRVLAALNVEITKANARAMQRTLRALKDAGWYRDDYRRGNKRPYNAWLSNYRAKNSTGREIPRAQTG